MDSSLVFGASHDRCLHIFTQDTLPKLLSLDQGGMNDMASSARWRLSNTSAADILALLDRRTDLETPTWSTPVDQQECFHSAEDNQGAYVGPCLDGIFGTINRCRIKPIHVSGTCLVTGNCPQNGPSQPWQRRPRLMKLRFCGERFWHESNRGEDPAIQEILEARCKVFWLSI